MTLSAKQQKALEALLLTNTNEQAAEEAGISRSTLQRYLNDPVFKAELNRHRTDSATQTNARLISTAAIAVQTLQEIMTQGNSELARVQAASQVLNLVYKTVEHDSVTEQRELKNEFMRLQIATLKDSNTNSNDELTQYFEKLRESFMEG